jgi:two-component system chemotaxis response regulator CheY
VAPILRSLLADPDPDVRIFVVNILNSERHPDVLNGIEALEKTLDAPFDLYVVDINMPKLDGYGFLRELRKQEIPQRPAIMVSTEAAAQDEETACRAGANGYLIKPVQPLRLLTYARLMLGEAVQ